MTKHIKIIEYALSSLLRRKNKSLAIIIAFTLTVTALSSILFLTSSLKFEASYVLASAPDLIVQKNIAGRHDLIPIKYAETIQKIIGVRTVSPRYWGYYYDAMTEANYTLQGTGHSAKTLKLLEGRLPVKESECAVGIGVAEIRSTESGGELILVNSENTGILFEVVGVFQAESSMLTHDLIVLTNQAIIDFFGFPPNQATDISVDVYNSNEVQTIAKKVKRLFPASRPITKSELIRTYDMVFHWRSGMMLALFSAAVISFCILAWDKATGISAEEKQEIGILKAIGWDTSDVLALKFWEGLIIAMTSFLAGIISGFIHVFFFGASILAPVLKGWSVLFPDFHLTPYFDVYQFFIMGFLTITPYVASTVIPSWKAAITDPETVMRG
jgi:lipoprotein-releasing system permease protein